jgi:hypothetical protein
MSKGSTPVEQTITQTNIPDEFMPYFDRLLAKTEELTSQPYQAYEGDRTAASSDYADIEAARDLTRDIAGSGIAGLSEAQAVASENVDLARQLGQYDTGNFSQYSGLEATQATPFSGFSESDFEEFQYSPVDTFTGDSVSQYMDPYMQNVVDIEKAKAQEDYDIAQQSRDASAVAAGAFGGSRQGVQEGMAESDLLQLQGDIQAQGLSSAYNDAQTMFEADRAAAMATETAQAAEAGRYQGATAADAARVQQANAEEMARVQGISVSEAARIQEAQAAELARVQTDREASRQFGASQGLASLDAAGKAGQQLVDLGKVDRETDIQNAQLLESIGKDQMGEDQYAMDIAYQDFLRQQGYPEEQLALMSDILRGLPVQNAGTTTSTGSVYTDPLQEAIGAGISGVSLYNAFQ